LTGITFYKGNIFVAHRGSVTMVKRDGSKEDIINGLPSLVTTIIIVSFLALMERCISVKGQLRIQA
jgi:hypothetical protein